MRGRKTKIAISKLFFNLVKTMFKFSLNDNL